MRKTYNFFMGILLVANNSVFSQSNISLTATIPIPDHPAYEDTRNEEAKGIAKYESADSIKERYEPLSLPITVSGLPTRIDSLFGLEKVQISVKHGRISDIKIELLSPDSTLVWLTNRNGKDGYDYDSTVFTQRGFNGAVSSAEAPFTGDYQPDGNLAHFNNGQNPNGVWTLRIYDLRPDTEGVFQNVVLSFSEHPAMISRSPCSFENPEGCTCTRDDGRLLPDLVLSENGTALNMWEVAYDRKKKEGMLMLEIRTMNIGEGPLELEGTDIWLCGNDTVANRYVHCREGDETQDSVYPRQIFLQNIYALKDKKIQKTSRIAGTMAYDGHPGHEHFHADYYAHFFLLKPLDSEPDTSKWDTVGMGRKASFCLWDMQFCDAPNAKCDYQKRILDENNLKNYGFGTYKSCDDPKRQGISVGGIDWYGLHYDGQNIHLPKGTTNGLYWLKIILDPYNYYEESNEDNNTLIIPVFLRFQQDAK